MIEYALIGKKLGHSFSAKYFNAKFEREGIPSRYSLLEMENVDNLKMLICASPDLRGLNVTIPFKQDVIPLLDSMTETAKAIGAVNTIRIDRDSDNAIKLVGHNTDAIGFQAAIMPLINGRKRALVLGQGGASKAVIYSLLNAGIEVTKVSRRRALGILSYDELTPEVMACHDIIVNCTPLGMWPNVEECPPIPYSLVNDSYLLFDLVYNPEMTEFLKRGASRGAEVSNGLAMLVGQAEAAYQFWNTREFHAEGCNDMDSKSKKCYLSREVIVKTKNSEIKYYLSIAEINKDSERNIISVKVAPFEKEACNVEYINHPLIIEI